MSRASAHLASLLLVCTACATPQPGANLERSCTLGAGPAGIGSQGWSGYDERALVSLDWTVRRPEWRTGVEFGIAYARVDSNDSSVSSGVDLFEGRIGVARDWRPLDWLRLVAGGGGRIGSASLTHPGTWMPQNDQDTSLGVYAHAGAFVRLSSGFSLGCDARWSDGSDYELIGRERDAQLTAILLALRWDF